MKSLEQVIFEMLTENTGTHFLDSGGSSGRMWQRNKSKTLKDFQDEPEATLEIDYNKDGTIYCSPTISVFHKLTKTLEIDDLCNEFNSQEVPDWDSDIYGVSATGYEWITQHFKVEGDSFNTYNWSANFSQVMQGQELKRIGTCETYVLLQIHGGADVRGGYTDAKLFKVSNDEIHSVINEDCSFDVVDWHGEFINHGGSCAKDSDFKQLVKQYKIRKGTSKTITGSINECY